MERASSDLVRWHGSFVLFALIAGSHVALIDLLGRRDARLVVATVDVREGRRDLNQIVGQQLTPGRQHGCDVRMWLAGIDSVLQHLDHRVRRRKRMRTDRRSGLASVVRVAGRQQSLEDVTAGRPVAVQHIVTFSGRRSEFARRTGGLFVGHLALEGVRPLQLQGSSGAGFQVTGCGR